ncbi:lysophospholipid acyltransferase family protein [Candidatus Poribacteria bacterium]|nr:lysophospholipid acyltransferase family protein [Candidatus Poribacteria bacterium]
MKKIKEKILLWLISSLGWLIIYVICSTIHIKIIGEEILEGFYKQKKCVIFTFWHDAQLFFVYYYRNRNIQVLVSESKDGEYISRTINKLGFITIRGSSSKSGIRALLKLVNAMNTGFDAGITPDGPRGPRHILKEGVLLLSQKTGAPIIPISFFSSKMKIFDSWDKFLLPLPFSKGVLIYGKPFIVPETCSSEEFENYKTKVETELNRIWDEAHSLSLS